MMMERTEGIAMTGSSSRRLADLYERHVGRAVALAALVGRDADAAEDIAHEAFIRTAGRLSGLRDPSAFDAYLRRTVVNLCRARARRASIERRYSRWLAQREDNPATTRTEDQDVLWRALRDLPHRQRAAVVLRYYEDLSEEQAADALRCSPRAVNALVSRAMTALRQRIQEEEADLAPGEWPSVEVGGVEDPYVDREVGADLDKTVVASGLVEGTEWSMTTFGLHGSGTCGELFLGDWGDYGGVRFCSRIESEPGQTDLRVAGTSFGLGPLTAYTGVVSAAVDRVVVELADGSHRSALLVNAPQGVEDRSFVVFVPVDAVGRIVAFDASGGRLASEAMCAGSPAPIEQVTSCGNGLSTTFSAVSGQP